MELECRLPGRIPEKIPEDLYQLCKQIIEGRRSYAAKFGERLYSAAHNSSAVAAKATYVLILYDLQTQK